VLWGVQTSQKKKVFFLLWLGNSQNQLHYSLREPPTPVIMETGLGFLVKAITIWAEQNGVIENHKFEWSFDSGAEAVHTVIVATP